MKKIYAPWRNSYVTTHDDDKQKKQLKNDCVFCQKFIEDQDEENLVIKRLDTTAIVMNKYPYNSGHIMALPLEHKPTLQDLPSPVRAEMMEATTLCTQAVQEVLSCEGVNVGINIGEAGGGGIPSHLHIHIIPRWFGDTNFLATVADTTLVCSDFYEAYNDLKKWLDQHISS